MWKKLNNVYDKFIHFFQQAQESCFAQVQSTDRRDAIAVSLTTSHADCSALCEKNSQASTPMSFVPLHFPQIDHKPCKNFSARPTPSSRTATSAWHLVRNKHHRSPERVPSRTPSTRSAPRMKRQRPQRNLADGRHRLR